MCCTRKKKCKACRGHLAIVIGSQYFPFSRINGTPKIFLDLNAFLVDLLTEHFVAFKRLGKQIHFFN